MLDNHNDETVEVAEHPCPDCGLPHEEYIQSSGYSIGQIFECGSMVRYDIEVTGAHQLIWHGPGRWHRSKGCVSIAAQLAAWRPVVEAAIAEDEAHEACVADPLDESKWDAWQAAQDASYKAVKTLRTPSTDQETP